MATIVTAVYSNTNFDRLVRQVWYSKCPQTNDERQSEIANRLDVLNSVSARDSRGAQIAVSNRFNLKM